jgi:protein gp37
MSDFFDNEVPDEWRDAAMAVIALTPHLDWLVLTKRPKVMRDYIGRRAGDWQVVLPDAFAPGVLQITKNDVERHLGRAAKFSYDPPTPSWPLPNLWLGVTAEDQKMADLRIPDLLATPAAKRFVSIEPLLGPIDLYRGGWSFLEKLTSPSGKRYERLDWVIIGGESGPKARRFDIDLARAIAMQCREAGTPYFVKQMGNFAVLRPAGGEEVHCPRKPERLGDGYWRLPFTGAGADPIEWPADLRVQEFPA